MESSGSIYASDRPVPPEDAKRLREHFEAEAEKVKAELDRLFAEMRQEEKV